MMFKINFLSILYFIFKLVVCHTNTVCISINISIFINKLKQFVMNSSKQCLVVEMGRVRTTVSFFFCCLCLHRGASTSLSVFHSQVTQLWNELGARGYTPLLCFLM